MVTHPAPCANMDIPPSAVYHPRPQGPDINVNKPHSKVVSLLRVFRVRGLITWKQGGLNLINVSLAQLVTNPTNPILMRGHGFGGTSFPTIFHIRHQLRPPSDPSQRTDNRVSALTMNVTLASFLSRPSAPTYCHKVLVPFHRWVPAHRHLPSPSDTLPSISNASTNFLSNASMAYAELSPVCFNKAAAQNQGLVCPSGGLSAKVTFRKIPMNRLFLPNVTTMYRDG